MATSSESDEQPEVAVAPGDIDQLDWAEFRFGDVDWKETDWDCKPSQLAQEAANIIWEMALCDIYANAPDEKVSMWCEWIQKAMYDKWLKNQEARMK